MDQQPPAPPLPSGTAPASRLADLRDQATRAWGAVLLAFAAGLLVGWVVLGWWLFPVQWTNTLPADLAPEYQAIYVQLVADAYVRDGDLAAAQAALAGFDAESLEATLDVLGANTDDPIAAQNARTLESALQASAAAAAPPAAATPATSGDTDLVGLTRTLAWVALIAALGAGLALAGVWLWSRRKTAAGGGGAPVYDFDSARRAAQPTGPAPAAGAPADSGEGGPTWAKPAVGPRRAVPAAGGDAAAGQSERIKLGQTVQARYRAGQTPPRQSWLIHDAQGELLGGAGWQARRIGTIDTIDFRVSDRDDLDQTTKTPVVRFVAPAAFADAILHGRLSGPQLAPAVPGESVTLRTVDLALDVSVQSAEPAPQSDETSLTALALVFTPRRNQPDSPSLFPLDDDMVWEDEEPEDEVDDAFGPEPPAPLKFRRE